MRLRPFRRLLCVRFGRRCRILVCCAFFVILGMLAFQYKGEETESLFQELSVRRQSQTKGEVSGTAIGERPKRNMSQVTRSVPRQNANRSYQLNDVTKEKKNVAHRLTDILEERKTVGACTTFHSRECTPIPIDLVYTWVNGSDQTLLRNLRVAKEQLDVEQGLLSAKTQCPLSKCVVAPMVVFDPGLLANTTSEDLSVALPSFSTAKAVLQLTKPQQPSRRVTVVVFHSQADAEKALTETLRRKTLSVYKSYLTTDKAAPGLVQMETLAYLHGFPNSYKASEELRGKLPPAIREKITAIELYPEASLALLFFRTPQDLTDLQKAKDQVKVDEKQVTISPVHLFWNMSAIQQSVPPKKETRDSLTPNRFQDNGALMYSLRSLEKHAPWVRHVFIVTNGQVPSWLNLQNPRVSIVTHQEIFPNSSHLPNFNSAAIESHIHRIPGISQRFLYLNDDIMFGKDVFLDDFYTPRDGQRVYLAWPVAPCSKQCPSSLINNGQCNQPCNNAKCQWDGGDCKGRKRRSLSSAGDGQKSSFFSDPQTQSDQLGEEKPMDTKDWNTPLGKKLQEFFPQELLEDRGLQKALSYETNGAMTGRKLQSIFAATLNHVNMLYNLKFGGMNRKVISHAPFMIDKLVMQELQDTFPGEFQKTSSHHVRHPDDMQYGFAYFYFLMSVKRTVNLAEMFDAVDEDRSGVLSAGEIQNLVMKIHKQPKPEDFTRLNAELRNCAKNRRLTKEVVMNCKPVTDGIRSAVKDQKKYRYQVTGQGDVHFKMLHNNLAEADRIFNDLQRNPRKFICINDDLDHTQSVAKEVQKKLAQFYQSKFPQPSEFELQTSNRSPAGDENQL
ncbi:N-acetylglucosamine-1-phosphotransferase subunits alpha/beta-like [Syngnathus typhle]|uniref:N-acetylglucosamine-1-phosphotransferase subunits alpha/beta-like n=1 Tax=Syngnathus typhle TaxID=161592 RepID=UPI002A69FBCB|nr:N-acetylglucosamine-1-phosphotransferase subunits alpha/beta-like [Syngnathus typhle]XP_061124447.1 N-acetylglucosamine-1-phosphotransferase subunits alpha/beta-like [Syngnathus typhle]